MGKENMNLQAKVGGKFKLVVRRVDGSIKKETGWIKNTITDIGLNRMGQGTWFDRIGVGSGSTPPTVSDVWLESQIAVSGSAASGVVDPPASINTSAPYDATTFIARRFNTGEATGNISEVVVAWGTTSGTAYARQLVRDEFGAPATITVLSDETLDVYYGITLYPPYSDPDQVGDFSIGGNSHSIIMRPARVGAVDSSRDWRPNQVGSVSAVISSFDLSPSAYNGAIGGVLGAPSGSRYSGGSVSSAAYVNNSFERSTTASFSLDQANLSGGVSSFEVKTSIGWWQIGFTPPIPKNNTKVMSLTFKISWARYVA